MFNPMDVHANVLSSSKTRLILLAVAAAATAVSGASADMLQEVHTYNRVVDNPAWDSTLPGTLDVTLFDTQGGSRQLVGYIARVGLDMVYTLDVHDNLTANWVGAEKTWSVTWSQTLFLQQPGWNGTLVANGGVGVMCAPFSLGFTETGGSGHQVQEAVSNANVLDMLTGTGTLSLPYDLTVSPLHVGPIEDPMHPVFDPDILDVSLDSVEWSMRLVYYYQEIPEPAAISLLGLAGALLLRRR